MSVCVPPAPSPPLFVPCPVDPSHTIRADRVAAHVLRCASAQRESELKAPAYYSAGINSLPEAALASPRRALDAEEVLRRVVLAVERLGDLPLVQLVADGCRDMLAVAEAQGASDVSKKGRHFSQQASIIGHLDRCQLLGPGFTYVELGAGRGGLAAALRQALPTAPIMVVDRDASKNKRDRLIRPPETGQGPRRSSLPKARRVCLTAEQGERIAERFRACPDWLLGTKGCVAEDCSLPHHVSEEFLKVRLEQELAELGLSAEQLQRVSGAYLSRKDLPRLAPVVPEETGSFMRARVDLRDLNFEGLAVEGPVVAIGKHLCGCATDLGITALRKSSLAGFGVATCCHQLCALRDYSLTGREFLCRALELEEEELPAAFEVLRTSSSWAVDGSHDRERFELGRACKRLLDEGRAEALRRNFGLEAGLLHYCAQELTLENRLLWAGPKRAAEETDAVYRR